MRETELVERFAAGDREAFDALYELYKDQAFRTAWFLAGNRADAEDIVQDTFVKVYVNIGQLKDAGASRAGFTGFSQGRPGNSQRAEGGNFPTARY